MGKKGNNRTLGGVLMAMLRTLLLGANIAAALLLVACVLGTFVPPQSMPAVALVCLFFPLALMATLAFLPVWLVLRWKYMALSAVALLLVSPMVQSYCPLHLLGGVPGHDCTATEIRFMQFNSHYFAGLEKSGADQTHTFLKLLRRERFDVICMQESNVTGRKDAILDRFMREQGYTRLSPSEKPYRGNIIYSRHPCVGIDVIDAPTQKFNRTAAYRLLVGGDTVTVVNAYLESFGLSEHEKESYRDSLGGTRQEEMARKMGRRMRMHGPQADRIMAYVQPLLARGEAVIVSGDFNDSPVSYACRRMRSMMTDAYRTAGWGPGFTMRETSLFFRIDHIFVSDRLTPTSVRVERSVTESDHYPIVAAFDLRPRL